jgi:hypothetical protein
VFREESLRELFDEISPISDFTGNRLELKFTDYHFDEPKYNVEECRERDATLAAPDRPQAASGRERAALVRGAQRYRRVLRLADRKCDARIVDALVKASSLDKDALVRILTEPKNALSKQFEEFFALDNVELVFTEDALEAAAEEALRHKTGARGLRSVLEDCLLDVMYEIPSRGDVKKCVIDADSIRGLRRPLLLSLSGQALDLWEADKGETA